MLARGVGNVEFGIKSWIAGRGIDISDMLGRRRYVGERNHGRSYRTHCLHIS